MSLRTKMLLVQALCIVVALSLVLFLARGVILAGFQELDKEWGYANIHRVRRAVEHLKIRLVRMAGDYAEWTDTFERFEGINAEDYDIANATQDMIGNLDADVFALTDLSGETVVSVMSGHYESKGLLEALHRYLLDHYYLVHKTIDNGQYSGLIPLGASSLLVGMRAVTRTDGSGESPGVVVFGKFLDVAIIADIEERTQTNLSFIALPMTVLPGDMQAALTVLEQGNSEVLIILSPIQMAGYFHVLDVLGAPAALIQVQMIRSAYIQGNQTLAFFLGIGFFMALVLLAFNTYFLQRAVLTPISRLHGVITTINRDDDLTRRIVAPSVDEVGDLAHAFNGMLHRLEQAYHALRERESLFRGMVEHLSGVVYRRLADDSWTKLYISDAIETFTGCSASDFVGNSKRTYMDMIHPEDRAEAMRIIKEQIARGEPYDIIYRLRQISGGTIRVHDKGKAEYDDVGNPIWLNGFIWDITDQLKAEETRLSLERQVQYVQKLESLGVLAGGIAHDFNNLLMVMLSYTELIMEDVTPSSPAYENLGLIRQTALHAADLCKQMLAYAGRGTIARETLDICELIRGMEVLLRSSIAKKTTLSLELPSQLPLIKGDQSQLRQVIMNLIINAAEAIGNNEGIIRLEVGIAKCMPSELLTPPKNDVSALPPCLFIKVSDSGCGMDENTLARIYEPFFTTKFTGRGLGMSAVIGIVRGHEGDIKVDSAPGNGTTFRVFLPLDATTAQPEVQGKNARENGCWQGHGTVLFVDDEPALRDVMPKVLRQMGFHVLIAADGREALDVYQRHGNEIQLVILDMTMPQMDGYETYQALCQIDSSVRVIIASGYSKHDIEARFADSALVGILHKPYSVQELKTCMRAHLERDPSDDRADEISPG